MSVRLGARERLRYIALTMDDVLVRFSLAAMSSNDRVRKFDGISDAQRRLKIKRPGAGTMWRS